MALAVASYRRLDGDEDFTVGFVGSWCNRPAT
jgi:hypothetical protein